MEQKSGEPSKAKLRLLRTAVQQLLLRTLPTRVSDLLNTTTMRSAVCKLLPRL